MTRSDSDEIKLKVFSFSIDLDFNFDNLKDNKQLVELLNYVRPEWTDLSLIKHHIFTEGSLSILYRFDNMRLS